MRSKLLVFSIVANIICVGAVVFLGIQLNESRNTQTPSTECPKPSCEVINEKYYHCETKTMVDEVSTYTYTHNFDFTFKDNELSSSAYYIKAIFNNKDAYDNFKVDLKGNTNNTTVRGIQDDNTLTRYYDFGIHILFKGETLDEYIKRVETENDMTCKEAAGDQLIRFE